MDSCLPEDRGQQNNSIISSNSHLQTLVFTNIWYYIWFHVADTVYASLSPKMILSISCLFHTHTEQGVEETLGSTLMGKRGPLN